MSVTDVIVIEIPLCFMVFPIRVSMSSLVDVDANPDSNTNISSTPIPKIIKNNRNNELRHKSNVRPSPTVVKSDKVPILITFELIYCA